MFGADMKCRLYGPCAVQQVTLNRHKQTPVTPDGHYIVALAPLVDGRNEIALHCSDAPNTQVRAHGGQRAIIG